MLSLIGDEVEQHKGSRSPRFGAVGRDLQADLSKVKEVLIKNMKSGAGRPEKRNPSGPQ